MSYLVKVLPYTKNLTWGINGIPWASLNSETYRLVTFVRYPPDSSVPSIILSSKGFVYLDEVCEIICYFCSMRVAIPLIKDDIDKLHKRTDCPMTKGAECNNISMDNRSLHNEKTLFTQFPEFRESGERSDDSLQGAHTPSQNAIGYNDNNDENARSSQPYDESGASVIVTMTTDLDEDGPMAQNDNSIFRETVHPSQVVDKSPPVLDEPDSMNNTNIPKTYSRNSNRQQRNTRQTKSQQSTTQQSNTQRNDTQQSNTQQSDTQQSSRQQSDTQQSSRQQSGTQQSNTQQSDTQQNNTQQSDTQQSSRQQSDTQQSSRQQSDTQQSNTQQSDTQQSSTQQNNTQQDSADSNSNGSSSEVTNFEKLGIITARPKRPQYASREIRMESFKLWPKTHHLNPEDVVDAGYFYTGYSDCVRCFYCGGGVRNWEEQDDVWVEHASWYPKCAFLIQEVGREFIDTVLEIKKEKEEISYNDVKQRMTRKNLPMPSKFKGKEFEKDAAVRSLVDNGLDKHVVTDLVQELKKQGQSISSDNLYEAAKERHLEIKEVGRHLPGDEYVSLRKRADPKRDKDIMETLRKDIRELRFKSQCKICMDAEISAIFLPCGHFATCTHCSHALKVCPVCRVGINGVVKGCVP